MLPLAEPPLAEPLLAEPLGVVGGAVEAAGGFEELVFSFSGGVAGAGEQAGGLLGRQGLEGAGGFNGLIENFRLVDAGDDDRDRLRESSEASRWAGRCCS